MASSADLARKAAFQKPPSEVIIDPPPSPEGGGEELLIALDVKTALGLLSKCQSLLVCIADRDICLALSNRERSAASRVARVVRTFLEETSPHYED